MKSSIRQGRVRVQSGRFKSCPNAGQEKYSVLILIKSFNCALISELYLQKAFKSSSNTGVIHILRIESLSHLYLGHFCIAMAWIYSYMSFKIWSIAHFFDM